MTDQNLIYFVIAIIGVIFTILSFAIGRNTASKNEGKTDGTILSELGYLKSSTDEIKLKLTRNDERDRDYALRLAIVEECIKRNNQRWDRYEQAKG
jgi:hypothetical protein